MSQENVEIVRRVYEAVASGDRTAVLGLYDPDIEWDMSRTPAAGAIGGGGLYRGHEGLRSWFREWRKAWASVADDLEELIDAGEHVISVVTTRGRGRASGAEVENKHHAGVWTISQGKVVRVVWFPSREEALEAAGLRE